ncbi:MAG: hypothetical protein P4L31_07265, partial [Candidatus Babeliales bacterium]|nr:hypothetical protein [Candidatus Babeliales bacterium]
MNTQQNNEKNNHDSSTSLDTLQQVKGGRDEQNPGLKIEMSNSCKFESSSPVLPEPVEGLRANKPFDYWLKKNSYYHKQVIKFYTFVIPEGSSVLHINCKNGYLLNAIKP